YSIFTRSTCLYALNEILHSDTFLIGDKTKYTFDERVSILNYLLICNERILNFNTAETFEDIINQGLDFFEYFAFISIPNNQYNISINSLAKLYKSAFFLKCLMEDAFTKTHLQKYFNV